MQHAHADNDADGRLEIHRESLKGIIRHVYDIAVALYGAGLGDPLRQVRDDALAWLDGENLRPKGDDLLFEQFMGTDPKFASPRSWHQKIAREITFQSKPKLYEAALLIGWLAQADDSLVVSALQAVLSEAIGPKERTLKYISEMEKIFPAQAIAWMQEYINDLERIDGEVADKLLRPRPLEDADAWRYARLLLAHADLLLEDIATHLSVPHSTFDSTRPSL